MTWQMMDSAPKEPGAKILAFDGERVGEAIAYEDWQWSDDADDTVMMIEWRWANDSCGCCWGPADPQPKLWQPLPGISIRERILAQITPDTKLIEIGTAAWSELKDQGELHDITLVDDKLFFKGVEINPFAEIDADSWSVE